MNKSHEKLTHYIDENIEIYNIKSLSEICDATYNEILAGYCAIKITHDDDSLECLYESSKFIDLKHLICKNLIQGDIDSACDLQEHLNKMIAEHFKNDFVKHISKQIDDQRQSELEDAGYEIHTDRENGEKNWIRFGRCA